MRGSHSTRFQLVSWQAIQYKASATLSLEKHVHRGGEEILPPVTFAYFKYEKVRATVYNAPKCCNLTVLQVRKSYVSLYLIGENLDKTRAHRLAQAGHIVQLMRGVYVDSNDDASASVLQHSVRIAKYLYAHAYLAAASAVLLGPTQDGRLFLSARRKQRTRIRGLEIVQNQAPAHPSVAAAVIDDGMGEFQISVSSIRQRFLEAFRIRSEHAASIDEKMRATIATRLIEEYGDPSKAADAVWGLARQNEWYREGERAERYLLRRPVAAPAKNRAAIDLVVAWHGHPVGKLSHDGFEWRWSPLDSAGPPLVRQTTPGKLPPFIMSLLPEGWLEKVLKNEDERSLLRSGKRYLSNITIVENESELATLPSDILLTSLKRFIKGGVFTGVYRGPNRGDIHQGFERNLAKIYSRADTPRLSGVQIKAPMYLKSDGELLPSTGKPFTHILKPAGTSGYESLPVVEWLIMELGRDAGLSVPATAIVAMPDDMPPALIVERFDIRTDRRDKRLLALEDFCSVLDLPPDAKYQGSMERVARAIRSLSTAPDEDLLIILKRALFSWIVADGDVHLKNVALLKVAEPGDSLFRAVRFSPLYDAVTTRVFPGLEHDRLALKVNGKDDRLRLRDFLRFAATVGLKNSDATEVINRMLVRMSESLERIALPKGLNYDPKLEGVVAGVLKICRNRLESFQ